MYYDGIITKPSLDELYHHGIQGMKWGVRRYQNEDGSLTEAGKKRYHVETGRFGKTRIVDQYGKKMSRRDKRYMEKALKTDLKTNDPEAYKEYKKSKIQSNMHRTYQGSETLLSKHSSRKGQAEVNKLVADYANKTLSALGKSKRETKSDPKWNRSSTYNKGFLDYLKKEGSKPEDFDDPELLTLIEMEYEDYSGKKAKKVEHSDNSEYLAHHGIKGQVILKRESILGDLMSESIEDFSSHIEQIKEYEKETGKKV